MNTENEAKQGSINIRELDLYNFNGSKISIKSYFAILDIQEDMFSPTVTGSVTLSDSKNLMEDFPIIGEERIVITYRTSDAFEWVTREFYVYDISDKTKISDKSFGYTLSFCSEEMLKNRTTLVTNSFKNNTPSDVVKKVLTNIIGTTKPLNIEQTFGVSTYIAPHIYPFEVIHSMSNRARSDVHHAGAAYLFFENKNGFNFVSIESLLNGKVYTYKVQPSNTFNTSDAAAAFRTVAAISQTKGISILNSITNGAFGVKTKSLDLMTKSLTDISYDHFDDVQYSSMNRINGTDPKLRMTTSQFKFKTNEGLYKYVIGNSDISASFKDRNVSKRYAQLSSFVNGPKVNIEVQFNSNLTAGDIINLDIKSGFSSDKEMTLQATDAYSAGKYLITCLRHIITLDKASTAIELARDSYTSDHEDLLAQRNSRIGL